MRLETKGRDTGGATLIKDFSLDFLLETQEIWRPYYEGELTVEDARQIASNMVEFFDILNEWEGESIATG